jgi:hypothetical protein
LERGRGEGMGVSDGGRRGLTINTAIGGPEDRLAENRKIGKEEIQKILTRKTQIRSQVIANIFVVTIKSSCSL